MTQVTRELIELAERVEKAEGADREIDFLIAEAISGEPEHWLGCRVRQDRWFEMSDWKAGDPIPVKWEWSQPAFTKSIDAAMSLVPEGWRVSDLHELEGGNWTALLWLRSPHAEIENPPTSLAATAALAIVAAALRARSAATL